MITGPVCKQYQIVVTKMKDMEGLELWRIKDGRAANQVFASICAIYTFLNQHRQGKIMMKAVHVKPRAESEFIFEHAELKKLENQQFD